MPQQNQKRELYRYKTSAESGMGICEDWYTKNQKTEELEGWEREGNYVDRKPKIRHSKVGEEREIRQKS